MANEQSKYNQKFACQGSWDAYEKDDYMEIQGSRHVKASDQSNKWLYLRPQPRILMEQKIQAIKFKQHLTNDGSYD